MTNPAVQKRSPRARYELFNINPILTKGCYAFQLCWTILPDRIPTAKEPVMWGRWADIVKLVAHMNGLYGEFGFEYWKETREFVAR